MTSSTHDRPEPSAYQDPEVIRRVLTMKRVAVVGLSANSLRASNFVGYYLTRHGYDVVPVNPRETEIFGATSYPDLRSVPGRVDVVDVFRDPSAVPDIVDEAIEIGARALWLQFGVIHAEAQARAAVAGMDVVADRCIKIEHARYIGRMHWLGFNTGTISSERRGI